MVLSDCQDLEKPLSKLVAQTWMDDGLAQRFLNEPTVVLQEVGINIDEFADVKVSHNSTGEQILQLTSTKGNANYEMPFPAKPAELTDELLNSFMSGEIMGELRGSCST